MKDKITTGGDIDSYCTKCRLNLEHIVVAMVGGAVVKVKCKTCGSLHRFKDTPAARPGAPRKKSVGSRSVAQAEADWEGAIAAGHGPDLPYELTRSYRAGDIIMHPVFGRGVVQKSFFKKCSVLFKDGERVLASSNT